MRMLHEAAEQGHAEALHNLGVMYYDGKGVGQSDAMAVKWYRKAAEQGDAFAQSLLGSMYAEGRGGLPQNFAKALKLLRAAQAQGFEKATEAIQHVLQMQREQQAAETPPPPPPPPLPPTTTQSPSPPSIPIGTRVELRGLQAKPELNGRRGVVVKFVSSTGRYRVELDERGEGAAGEEQEGAFSLKAGNLLLCI